MTSKLLVVALAAAVVAGTALISTLSARAGESMQGYRVLAPIRHGNLTVFPVVAATSHDTRDFLTLDEGLHSGEVVVSEYGSIRPLMRRRPVPIPESGARVNQLVLVNNSKRPLILLAGEIVTGGKQDRVIGKDRIVPAESDPVDLSVFCVEPGRWTGASAKFGETAVNMAQPAVRAKAMSDKNQQMVWAEVGKTRESLSAAVPAPAAAAIGGTSSYARVVANEEVKKQVDSMAEPIQRNYESLIKQLRDSNAVGVVVAVNGEIVWADIFASTDLLGKYWPKLVRSYATEAIVTRAKSGEADIKAAQIFLDNIQGQRQISETEPGLYRHTEITGDGFKAFELTSLLPKTGFDLHVAKMAQ